MRRWLALLGYAAEALGRRRGRALVLTLALSLVSAATASVFFLGESLRSASAALAERAPALTLQRLVAGRPALLEEAVLDELGSIASVRAVRPRVWGYVYQAALEANVTVIGIDETGLSALRDGLAEAPSTLGGSDVLIGPAFAHLLGLRAGDRLAMAVPGNPEPLVLTRVAGVLPEDTSLAFGDVVLASPETARAILGVPDGFVTDAVIDVFPPEEAGIVSERIVERMPGARLVARDDLSRRWALTFEARGGLLSATLLPLLLAFLVLAWDRMSGLAEGERREIGILKAVGWSTADVLAARLFETGLIAALGTSVGLVLAHVFVFHLGAPGLREAYFGWSNLRPPASFSPASADVIVLLFSVVVGPYVALSVVPAWRAAIVDPDRAMRGEP